MTSRPLSGLVLLVADLFHPVDGLSVECLSDGDVRHGSCCRCAMPMLLAGREPDHVPRPDLLNWPARSLYPAASRSDDERLAERMRVPRSASTGLECDDCAADSRRGISLKSRIDSYRTSEPV